MKLLIISDNSVWGGSEVLWYSLQQRLGAAAVAWSPWGTSWMPPDVPRFLPARRGFGLKRRAPASSFTGDAVLYVMCFFSPERLLMLSDIIRPLVARGTPVTVLVQAVNPALWVPDEIVSTLRPLLDQITWVFVSEANAEAVSRHVPAAARRHVVYNVPLCAIDALPMPDAGNWAFVGRCHTESKGLDLLIESCVGFPVTVDIYGDGPNERALRAYAAALKSNVRFRGRASDVAAVWRDHPVCVLSSRFEGTPLVVVEAGLSARPAVVTRAGGSHELVDERCGVVTEINASSLRAGMEAMLDRSAEWPVMGMRLRERCMELVRADPVSRLLDVIRGTR